MLVAGAAFAAAAAKPIAVLNAAITNSCLLMTLSSIPISPNIGSEHAESARFENEQGVNRLLHYGTDQGAKCSASRKPPDNRDVDIGWWPPNHSRRSEQRHCEVAGHGQKICKYATEPSTMLPSKNNKNRLSM
jgi:hypothetical protein